MIGTGGIDFGSIGLTTAALGLLVCFAGGMLGGLSGYGTGLIVTLFITPVLGPKALVPVISVMMLINNASRVWFYRHAITLGPVIRISAAAVPMAWVGAELYVRLDGAAVQIILGAVLIVSVPLRRWVSHKKLTPSPVALYAVGGLFGFLSSVIVGAGLLIVPTLMGVGLMGGALISTDAAIAVVVNIAKTIIFGGLGALDIPLALLALGMGLATIPGTWIAAAIVRRTSLRVHTLLIEALLMVGGAMMIFRAL